MQIPLFKAFKTDYHFRTSTGLAGILVVLVLFGTACQSPQNQVPSDALVMQEVEQINALVDSLVINENPDPVGFILRMKPKREEARFSDEYRKYMAAMYYHIYRRNFDVALRYADRTLQLFENKSDDPAVQRHYLYAILGKVDVLRRKKLYGTSIQYLLQGWQMINVDETPCLASLYLGRLATVSYMQENYHNAIDYRNKAWNATEVCEDSSSFSYSEKKFQYFQNIASAYSEVSQSDSALSYINLSLDVIDTELEEKAKTEANRHFIEMAKGVALGNYANELYKVGEQQKAEEFWKESIRINLQPGFADEHAQFMRIYLAEFYINTGRMVEADTLLNNVKTWLDSNTSETGKRRWLKASWQWLENNGDYRQAYEVYHQYVELQTSVYESRRELVTLDLNSQIQLLENQHHLEQMEADSQLRNAYFIFILVISMMALAILFLVWRSWKNSQKSVLRLKDLNYAIRKKNLQLEEQNRAISKIMSIVSHDLRSPLSGVREISAVMKGDETLGKEHRKWAGLIHSTTNQSLKLMKEILNFNLHKTGNNGFKRIPVLKKSVSVRSLLQNCVDLLQLKANEKNQTIHLECPAKLNAYMDKDKMTRVINNVIDNAIKFSPRNTSIEVKAEKKPSSMLISITDYGIGIPEQKIDEIFDIHSHSSKRRGTDNEESHGLGLSISKEIVEAHGGAIWLESQELAGTTFFIELPTNSSKNVKALTPRYDKDSSS